ncbi:MAG: sugar phosphate isomerase/epimerase family protein [Methanomassiliicoccales archaeon]
MIAVSSPVFSMLDFEMALGFVSQKFDAWEIIGEGRHFLPSIEKQFLEVAPSYPLQFSAHAPLSDVNIGSLNPRLREAAVREIIDGLKSANRMNFDVYTIHPGFWSPIGLLDKEGVYEAVHKSLSEIEKASMDTGVRVALENMPNMQISMGRTPDDLMRMLDGFEIDICFDVGHAHTCQSIDEFCKLTSRFVNVHVHDNRGEYDEHLPIGSGTIDFRRVLKLLTGYKGRLVIEARSMPDAEISKERLEKLLAEAR